MQLIIDDITKEDFAKISCLFSSVPITVKKHPEEEITKKGSSLKKKKPHPAGFWQIPFGTHTPEYYRWLRRCNRYNLPYPEAKVKYERDHPTKEKIPDPAKSIIALVSDQPLATKTNRELPEIIVPVPVPGPGEISLIPPLPADLLKKGSWCRQCRSDRGKLALSGKAEVIEIQHGIIRVRDLSGNFFKLPAECLIPA